MEQSLQPESLRRIVLNATQTVGADSEYAVLDVREEADYAEEHLLVASNAPLSRLELLIPGLVPRRSTRLILCDSGDGLALRALNIVRQLGYSNASVLEGGLAVAQTAGFRLFSGTHVPSKAFGELVEILAGTPHIDASDLKTRLDRGDDLIVLDSRPPDEYHQMSIPGASNIPGAELVYRIHDLVKNDNTTIVINCAGRTRSIIGAQSLRNAGVKNPVFALRNGTMGWHLAGFELNRGEKSALPPISAAGLLAARTAAARVSNEVGVRSISRDLLDQWRQERDKRNLFIFDIRSRDEFLAGHLQDAKWVLGVQLVQATDVYVGVRNARIVVVDDTAVRATMTASWLIQMGWRDIAIYQLDPERDDIKEGMEIDRPSPVSTDSKSRVSPKVLHGMHRDQDVAIIDLALSPNYIKGHIPGARFAIRSKLHDLTNDLQHKKKIVLTSEDGTLAELARQEFVSAFSVPVFVLGGGTAAWSSAGLSLESGWSNLNPPGDLWIEPYDYQSPEEINRQMQRYIDWEIGLTDQVREDASIVFSVASELNRKS